MVYFIDVPVASDVLFVLGAQTDIFLSPGSATQTSINPGPSSTSPPLGGKSGATRIRMGVSVLPLGALIVSLRVALSVL